MAEKITGEAKRERRRAVVRQAQSRMRLRHGDRLRAKAKRARLRNKAYVLGVKAQMKCGVCGESDPVVLDFHHRNPADKKFEVCQHGERSQVAIEAEIAKCDVLCANCHRRHHASHK